jgi:hypothetical protein
MVSIAKVRAEPNDGVTPVPLVKVKVLAVAVGVQPTVLALIKVELALTTAEAAVKPVGVTTDDELEEKVTLIHLIAVAVVTVLPVKL